MTSGARSVVGLLTFLASPVALIALAASLPIDVFVVFGVVFALGVLLLFFPRVRYVGAGVATGTLSTLAFLLWFGSQMAGID